MIILIRRAYLRTFVFFDVYRQSSGRRRSSFFTMSCPLLTLAGSVFLLSLLILVLPTIYTNFSCRLFTAFPLLILVSKWPAIVKYSKPSVIIMWFRHFHIHLIFFILSKNFDVAHMLLSVVSSPVFIQEEISHHSTRSKRKNITNTRK